MGPTSGSTPAGDPPDAAAARPAPSTLLTGDELERLSAAVRADEAAFLGDLAHLVGIDCGSFTPGGVDEVGRFVADFLSRLGATVETHPDAEGRLGSTVVGRIRGQRGAPRILLIAHLDTVFPEGTAAARPFRIEDGIARGPGVTDMKSGLLAGLYALRAVRSLAGGDGASGALPYETLMFVGNPDEEIGSPSSTPIIAELAGDADACLVLECARANGDIVSSRKGNLTLRLIVKGRAAHAGVEPEKGRSAVLAAANVIVGLHALNGRWPGVTVNVGVVEGGTRSNVVAEHAELEIDVRAVTRESLVGAEAAIGAITAAPGVPDVTVETEELARHWPMEKLERSGRLVQLAAELAGTLGFELRDAATGGASDANTTAGLGVPTIDGLGPIGGLDHSPEEYLEVGSIVPRTTLLAALLVAIARDPEVRGWRAGRLADAAARTGATDAGVLAPKAAG
jgi:glutamate carboxypeptidase